MAMGLIGVGPFGRALRRWFEYLEWFGPDEKDPGAKALVFGVLFSWG